MVFTMMFTLFNRKGREGWLGFKGDEQSNSIAGQMWLDGSTITYPSGNLGGTSGCLYLRSGNQKLVLADCNEIHQPICKIGKRISDQ